MGGALMGLILSNKFTAQGIIISFTPVARIQQELFSWLIYAKS